MASATQTANINSAVTTTLHAAVASGKILRVPAGALWIENADSSDVTITLQVTDGADPCGMSILIPDGATWVNSNATASDFIISNGSSLQIVTTGSPNINYYCGALEGDA